MLVNPRSASFARSSAIGTRLRPPTLMPRGITRQRPVIEHQTRRRRSDAPAIGGNSCPGPAASEATWQFTQGSGVMCFPRRQCPCARHVMPAELPYQVPRAQLSMTLFSCQSFPGPGRWYPGNPQCSQAGVPPRTGTVLRPVPRALPRRRFRSLHSKRWTVVGIRQLRSHRSPRFW